MRVGDKLAELLMKNGVRYVFGVPGGQTLPLYEGIRKLPGQIDHILMRDERSAGFAADAYARLTGRVGVCDGTVGPGATNLVSPLAEAYCSSIPMLAIISDIPRAWEHRRHRGNASQAMKQLEMFQTVSKWQVQVSDPKALENTIDAALRVATTGKPGPVVVSIPDDIGSTDFPFRERGNQLLGAVYPRSRCAPDPLEVAKASQMILESRKPLLVIGGGAHISGCYQQVRDLAEQLNAPVVTSISGKGIIEETHPQAFGVTGTFGNPITKEIMQSADLVFFIGCKVGQMTTFSYRIPDRNTPIIHLDADPEEIGRNYPDSVPLLGDASLGLDSMITALAGRKPDVNWDFESYKRKHQQWYAEKTGGEPLPEQPLRPQAVMGSINKVLTSDDLVVCDASLSSGWTAAFLQFTSAGRNFIAPRGLAGLGWGLPASIGAALAVQKQRRVLQFAGDGGFGYSVQELEVMKRLDLPVVSIVFNNDTLSWIKHVQRDYYDKNYISTDFSHIDFATVARGFGVRSYTALTIDELDGYLEEEKSPQGPAVIEVISDQWESPVVG
ncbi:MAG: thiamine pyrophosphate-binding protein [Deltaproteobacteria bacterium]|jgi:acetolactate synthase I/II/III large subunit|nr:thiamine pyrophosphate-binding protein [Deltaproteobacteria bacterium]MBT4262671.1 thiamine pyrophosphate-binding protein [Deltaproteobacteria bacterium]MBT4643216.1 thiamine pyrophosphate-binding protein [Deltaproteobacteria bacterium]MBT6503755.1 thiamine pyrophosphate-binding protein [Deltaproteobacteria bacterium]MBT7152797.1 thiamine pyrophosphate-binding protein [Deltaproteobacteria bacterium]